MQNRRNAYEQGIRKQSGSTFILAAQAEKLTQEQLAARMQLLGCDITRSALAKIEVGQRMLCPDELKALRSALAVSYDDILL